jgi:hypothetical protein
MHRRRSSLGELRDHLIACVSRCLQIETGGGGRLSMLSSVLIVEGVSLALWALLVVLVTLVFS